MLTYKARIIDEIIYQPHTLHGAKVGVFRVEGEREEQVGEYERNYPALFNTFFHFTQNGRDFALYSPDYTVTRIMELPSCKDIGGEEPHSYGFCPVEYFVPTYVDVEYESTLDNEKYISRKNNPQPSDLVPETITSVTADARKTTFQLHIRPVTLLLFYHFGFVAGCIWGDDSSWKIQYLDLSEAGSGVVKREEKFGYIEMPRDLELEQAIDMSDFGDTFEGEAYNRIKIAVARQFDMDTSEWINPEGTKW